jgi:hypothetical protein
MSEDDWRIVGTQTVSGRYGTDWLTIYAAHAHDHAERIMRTETVLVIDCVPAPLAWPTAPNTLRDQGLWLDGGPGWRRA